VVLIIKTADEKYEEIVKVVKSEISYDNFIGQFNVEKINSDFEFWLYSVVK